MKLLTQARLTNRHSPIRPPKGPPERPDLATLKAPLVARLKEQAINRKEGLPDARD